MAGRHAESALKAMNERRQNDAFCDFAIKVGETSFPVHRLVLDSCSEYFRGMFSHDMLEARQGFVELKNFEADDVKVCVDFMYTGKASPSMDNVETIMHVSNMWQLHELTGICTQLLRRSVDFENCFRVKNMATLFDLDELKNRCANFISNNIQQLVEDGDWSFVKRTDIFSYIEKLTPEPPMIKRGIVGHLNNREKVHRFSENAEKVWIVFVKWSDNKPHDGVCDIIARVPVKHFRISFIQRKVWMSPQVSSCPNCKRHIAQQVLGNCKTTFDSSCSGEPSSALKSSIDEDNWFFLKGLAETYQNEAVSKHIENYVIKHFARIARQPEFGDLSKDDFLRYLRSPQLSHLSLQNFMEIVVRWILHRERERKLLFKELSPCIKLCRGGGPAQHTFNADATFAMKAFAKRFECPLIEQRADEMILKNFTSVIDRPEFMNLEQRDLLHYIQKRNDCNVETTWKSVVAWAKYDISKREEAFPQLFRNISFENASSNFLQGVVWEEQLVKNSSSCKDILVGKLLGQVGQLQKKTNRMEEEITSVKKSISRIEKRLDDK